MCKVPEFLGNTSTAQSRTDFLVSAMEFSCVHGRLRPEYLLALNFSYLKFPFPFGQTGNGLVHRWTAVVTSQSESHQSTPSEIFSGMT